jgi:hypothetical protein
MFVVPTGRVSHETRVPNVFCLSDHEINDDQCLSDLSFDCAGPNAADEDNPSNNNGIDQTAESNDEFSSTAHSVNLLLEPTTNSPFIRFPKVDKVKKKNLVKFTLAQKRHILSQAYPTNGPSCVRKVAREYGVVHGTITNWKSRFSRLVPGNEGYQQRISYRIQTEDSDNNTRSALYDPDNLWIRHGKTREVHGPHRKTLHGGAQSKIPDWAKVHLCRWFDDLRGRAIMVTVKDMVNEFMTIAPESCVEATMSSLRQRMYRFMREAGIAHRAVTHVAQNTVHSLIVIQDFQRYIRQVIQRHSIPQENIVNGDETNCDWSPPPKKTLSREGANSVAANSTSSSQRCTALLCVTAAGTKLPPFVIFSGTKNGRIKNKELVGLLGYPTGLVYTCQKCAWMDEPTMLEWLEFVWKPFVESREGLCLLLLDEARSHMTAKVVRRLGELRTVFEIIPGGYTAKLQVLDVGLNRPFKFYYQEASQEFVRNWTMNHLPGEKPKPTRQIVAGWISHAWSHIDQDMIRNTWRRCDYIALPGKSINATETLEQVQINPTETSEQVQKHHNSVENSSTIDTDDSTTIS